MEPANRRSEVRIEEPVVVFVEVRAGSPDSDAPAEILACRSIDISANGLQALLDRALPVGAILRLGADPSTPDAPMYVVGEVRWVRPSGAGFLVGFAFFDSDGTDIVAWKNYIAGRLAG